MKRPFHQYLLLFMTGTLCSFCWACSQTRPIIRETYGYFAERQPGNIPVDQSGNPLPGFGMDTVFTLYVTSSVKDLKWDTAWAGIRIFSIVATEVPGQTIEAGVVKEQNQVSVIKAGKGSSIWRLDLIPLDPLPEIPGIFRKGVFIKGTKGGKPFQIQIDKLVELRVPPSV